MQMGTTHHMLLCLCLPVTAVQSLEREIETVKVRAQTLEEEKRAAIRRAEQAEHGSLQFLILKFFLSFGVPISHWLSTELPPDRDNWSPSSPFNRCLPLC